MEKKEKITVHIAPDKLRKLEALQKTESAGSRNAVIEAAVDFYYSYKNSEISQDFLCSIYGQKVEGVVGNSTKRINSNLFKLAVEMNIVSRLLASQLDISKDQYDSLRRRAVEDAKSTKGIISAYEAQV
ncbi:MAG: hypothetical protein IJV48_06535 [Ruminococcus sp.]|nr:hypothetical protein [Ruminococcus sp.]